MFRIISARSLPDEDFYVNRVPLYNRVNPERLDQFFEQGEAFDGNLVNLLLNNESTAVYYLNQSNIKYLGGNPKENVFVEPVLLGVNYHHGSSEGNYKVIVQNIPERKGPWVLYRPPGSNETTFYLQDLAMPLVLPPKFEREVVNPLKIHNRYLFQGNPLEIFEQFRIQGFSFVDRQIREEHLWELRKFEDKYP